MYIYYIIFIYGIANQILLIGVVVLFNHIHRVRVSNFKRTQLNR